MPVNSPRNFFNKGYSPRLAWFENTLDETGTLTADQLAEMFESNPGPLTDRLRDYVVNFLRDPDNIKKRRGRRKDPAIATQILQATHYRSALQVFQWLHKRRKQRLARQKRSIPRGDLSPSEQAYAYLGEKWSVDPGTLRNTLSRKKLLPNKRRSPSRNLE